MLVDEKPPLDEDLLMHFGVPGMKWGQRKARNSGGSAAPKQKMSTQKKVAIGLGVAAVGASVAAYVLSKRGGAAVRPLAKAAVRLESKAATSVLNPSPFAMRMEAGMAAHRNSMNRIGSQRLTDQLWRNQAKVSQLARTNAKLDDDLISRLMNANSAMLRGS